MPDVTFSIGNRSYTLRCASGQEDHLRQMAAALDQRIQPIAEALPGADDRHLLVIGSIALLDELAAAQSAASESVAREATASGAVQAHLVRLDFPMWQLACLGLHDPAQPHEPDLGQH